MKKCPQNFHVNNRGFSVAVETFFTFTFEVLTSKTIHCSKLENIRVNFKANKEHCDKIEQQTSTKKKLSGSVNSKDHYEKAP